MKKMYPTVVTTIGFPTQTSSSYLIVNPIDDELSSKKKRDKNPP